MSTEYSEDIVTAFWENHPCGDEVVGGLWEQFEGDYESFFTSYDRARYALESHIPQCLDQMDVSGKRLLEIGLGEGAESEGLIRRGARWTGLDVTDESVRRVGQRLASRHLPHEGILHGSTTKIPAPDDSFDVVFAHGVFHHVPDINAAQTEVHRVLRPDGRLVAMLYSRSSLNYMVSIAILRRTGLLLAWPWRKHIRHGLLAQHLGRAEREGLWNHLRLEHFLNANTDGPDNPLSRVYDIARIKRDFPSFRVLNAHKEFMHAPPLPVHGLPGARLFGWHLWVELEPR